MAFLDDQNRAVVLRVVYAGPPMAGKTETLHALSRLLLGARHSDAVFTPEEVGGRTLFFDWLEYSAGLFQGRKIRCQIVSVPGQGPLLLRRKALIESADAAVFVVDAHAGQGEAIGRCFSELRQLLARPEDEPPVGVVVQANKSDLPEALPNEALRQLLDDSPHIALVRTVATEGTGVREAFVHAVGLALTRVRELLDAGKLQPGDPDIHSGEDLLRRLRALEEHQFGQAAAPEDGAASIVEKMDLGGAHLEPQRLSAILEMASMSAAQRAAPPEAQADTDAAAPQAPRVPDPNVGAGTVWPAVAGRIILHEIAGQRVSARQLSDAAWLAEIPDSWRMVSLDQHRFEAETLARDELLRMARLHAAYKPVLSEHRCITFAQTGFGDWRVWQVVRRDKTLSDVLSLVLELPSPESIAMELLRAGRTLWGAVETFREAAFPCPVTLGTLAVSQGRPVYAGFLLAPPSLESEDWRDSEGDVADVLRTELQGVIGTLAARGELMPRLLRQLESGKRGDAADNAVADTLIGMCLRHG